MQNAIDIQLTELQREYLNILVSNIKLNDVELKAKFGDELEVLRRDVTLRRLSAEIKIERQSRKDLADELKLTKYARASEEALNKLLDIMRHGKDFHSLQAAKELARPALKYLEKHCDVKAELDSVESADSKYNFTLNVTPIGSAINK